jgi:hypothetical protein
MFVVPICAIADAVKATVWDPADPAIAAVTPAGTLQPVIVSPGTGEEIVTGGALGWRLMAHIGWRLVAHNCITDPRAAGTPYTYDCASHPTGVSELSVTYAAEAPEGMFTLALCADPRLAE